MFKRVFIALSFVVLALLLTIPKVFALGTPQITNVSPGSGSPVGTCINVSVAISYDPEYRAMRVRFGNDGWQESSETSFSRTFCTGNYSAGWYKIRVEAARKDDNNWSNPAVTEMDYELTGSAQPTQPPSPPYGPSFNVSFNPTSAAIGQDVQIHVTVNSNNPGATRTYVSCSDTNQFENTSTDFTATWHTSSCSPGNQTVRICSRDVNDPNWQNANCQVFDYSFSASPNPIPKPTVNFWADTDTLTVGNCTVLHWRVDNATSIILDGNSVGASEDRQVCPTVTVHYSLDARNDSGNTTAVVSITVNSNSAPPTAKPNFPFSNSDVIQIDEKIFVICNNNQRCWVPNPATLDALGITRSWINNKGWSKDQLSTITQGPDIPDVNRDPAGFQNFKNRYFPNTTPITPNNPPAQPTTDTSCPSAPTRLSVGQIALVSDWDNDPLTVRDNPQLSSNRTGAIPIREPLTIVNGPKCGEGRLWWQIGYKGLVGWVIEVTNNNNYNLIPNGMCMPGYHGQNNCNQSAPQPNTTNTPVSQLPTNTPMAQSPKPTQTQSNTSQVESNDNQEVAIEYPETTTDNECPTVFGQIWKWISGHCEIVPDALGANITCTPQCVSTARSKRSDLSKWAPSYTDGSTTSEDILNTASTSPIFTMDGKQYQIKVKSSNDSLESGDLVIWSAGCGNAWNGKDSSGNWVNSRHTGGHIGYLESVDGDTLYITDSNWFAPTSSTCTARNNESITKLNCMSFIGKPQQIDNQTNNSNNSSNNTDNAGNSSQKPAVCSQRQNWLEIFRWIFDLLHPECK